MSSEQQRSIQRAGAKPTGELIHNQVSNRVVRRNYRPMGFWLWSPAICQPFLLMLWALDDLAVERKVDLGIQSQVTRVRLARVKKGHRFYLYPTDWNDPQGIEVTRTKKKVSMNFYQFLAEASMLVETGYAERFGVELAGADSPVGPALVFDRLRPAARKNVKPPARTQKRAVNEQPAHADT